MKKVHRLAFLATALTLAFTTVGPALAENESKESGKVRGQAEVRSAVKADRGDAREAAKKERGEVRGAAKEARAERDDDDEGRSRGRALHGEISAITGTIWAIDRNGRRDGGSLRVDVSGARVHWPGNDSATLRDFQVGDTVNVKLEMERERADGRERDKRRERGEGRRVVASEMLHAQAVQFVPERSERTNRDERGRFRGSVTAVNATSLTVSDAESGSKTFTLNTNTRVHLGKEAGTLTDIHLGDRVSVSTRPGEAAALVVLIRR